MCCTHTYLFQFLRCFAFEVQIALRDAAALEILMWLGCAAPWCRKPRIAFPVLFFLLKTTTRVIKNRPLAPVDAKTVNTEESTTPVRGKSQLHQIFKDLMTTNENTLLVFDFWFAFLSIHAAAFPAVALVCLFTVKGILYLHTEWFIPYSKSSIFPFRQMSVIFYAWTRACSDWK